MKNFLCTTFATFALGTLALVPPAMASTPDGETPAEETVCDVLKDDGVTKGLYGLCVAFCEAQDHAALSDPITEDDLEALLDATPSGRILNNYNKKKDKANNPLDPDMPCIKVEEPCPCWDSAEFDTVVNSSNNVDICRRFNGPVHDGSYIQHYDSSDFNNSFRRVLAIDHRHNQPSPPYVIGSRSSCSYQDFTQSPRLQRSLSTTPDEFAACDAQIRQAALDTSRSCTDST